MKLLFHRAHPENRLINVIVPCVPRRAHNSQAGWRENVHANATGSEPFAGESHQVVRLPLAHTKVLRRGTGRVMSSG